MSEHTIDNNNIKNYNSDTSESDNSEYEIIKSPTEKFNKIYYKLFKSAELSDMISKLKKFKTQNNLCYNIIDFLQSDEYKKKFNKSLIKNNTKSNNVDLNSNIINTSSKTFIIEEDRIFIERELMESEDINLPPQHSTYVKNSTFTMSLPKNVQEKINKNNKKRKNLPYIMKQSIQTTSVNNQINKKKKLSISTNDDSILLKNIETLNTKTSNVENDKNIFDKCMDDIFNCINYFSKCISDSCVCIYLNIKKCFK